MAFLEAFGTQIRLNYTAVLLRKYKLEGSGKCAKLPAGQAAGTQFGKETMKKLLAKKNGNSFATLALLCAASLASVSCNSKTAANAPDLAVPVSVAKAVKKTVPIELTAIGTGEAYSTVSIKGQVNAVLEQVHFKQGDFVKKGDLLFTLDARPFQASLAQAQANLARDKAQADLTEVQAERYEKLYAPGVAPKEQYDQMKANAAAQEGSVHADEAAVESAKLQLQYCTIYSPVDGRTGALQVYPGNLGEGERRSSSRRDQSDRSTLRGFFCAGTVSGRDQEIHGRRRVCKLRRRLTATPRPKRATSASLTILWTTPPAR